MPLLYHCYYIGSTIMAFCVHARSIAIQLAILTVRNFQYSPKWAIFHMVTIAQNGPFCGIRLFCVQKYDFFMKNNSPFICYIRINVVYLTII